MNTPAEWRMDLPDEAATVLAATRLAGELRAGDLLTLGGDLGAGKTTFARALIRHFLGDPLAEVPSPTYTLLQSYEGPRFNIVHADLYRIHDPAELAELGWEDAAENALVLVEWAERAGEILAADRLEVHLETTGPTGAGRRLTLTGHGSFAGRLARARQIQTLLDRTGFGEARRDYMLGDASVRAYERLTDEATGRRAILMIAPRRPDGPPIRLGKPYSTLVHLAESVHAFVAVGEGLRREGFSAPEIYGADLEAGLLVIEDLGPEGVMDENGPIPERYRASVEMLAALHARELPAILPVAPGQDHKLFRYDLEALTIEAELLLDWYFPYAAKRSPNASVRLSFVDHWVSALEPVVSGPKTWALRDFHSPNIIWLPEREGHRKVGLIDYQDCVLGHPAYDVVSLTQDARVTVPEALELQLLAAYVRARRLADPAFDAAGFTAAYALLGAQRATKILGIFVRLDRRDGKPVYLGHLPRVEAYLKRCLAHPALAKLRGWYETNLPGFAPLPRRGMNSKTRITHAMLLAAGLGTRMRPLTDERPKPLIQAGGKTLLDHNLDQLVGAGVETVVVNVHYLAEQVEVHCARRKKPRILISDERAALLDSGGGVKKALPQLGPGPFFCLNADTIWLDGPRSNLVRMAEQFDPDRMDILLLLAPTVTTIGWGNRGDFRLLQDGRLERAKRNEVVPFAYCGAAILKPELFRNRPDIFSLNRLFDEAQEAGRLFGMRLDGLFMHVGTPEALREAEDALRLRVF